MKTYVSLFLILYRKPSFVTFYLGGALIVNGVFFAGTVGYGCYDAEFRKRLIFALPAAQKVFDFILPPPSKK